MSMRWPKRRPRRVSATTSAAPAGSRPDVIGGAPSPPGRYPITLTSLSPLVRRSVEWKITSGSASRTPGRAATWAAASAGMAVTVVNGPDVPRATNHRSAPTTSTMRRVSVVNPASAPAISNDMANTSAVAATAMRKRLRRHWRSRRLTNHMAAPVSGSGVEPGLQRGCEHHVASQTQLALHEGLHAVELPGDETQEVGQAEREGDPRRVGRALGPGARAVVDLELIAVRAVGGVHVPLDDGALAGRLLRVEALLHGVEDLGQDRLDTQGVDELVDLLVAPAVEELGQRFGVVDV